MAPHAISPPPPGADSSREQTYMTEFGISKNGFLPSEAPLRRLPDSYYTPWERLIHHLPDFLKNNTLRQEVKQLPILSTQKLSTEAEWRRAYVILTFLTHGYVWGGETPEEVLPPAISTPLLRVSDHLELPPVATYAGLNLWNFSSRNGSDDFTHLDNLQSLHTFTGTEDEAWFYLVSVAMEAEGAHIVSSMMAALKEAAGTRDDYYNTAAVTVALERLTWSIRKMGALLERMYERCDPMVFFYQIRPFLAGSKNMAAAGLPNGVFYDEGNGRGSWRQLRGGSNGQSSLIQFLDIVLGVEHVSHGGGPSSVVRKGGQQQQKQQQQHTGEKTFHEEVRDYMPGPHRRFLEHVITRIGSSVREMAASSSSSSSSSSSGHSDKQMRLREAYTAATKTLTDFRNKHLQIVARYIVIPSKKGGSGSTDAIRGASGGRVNLATASGKSRDTEQLTGTGGTSLMPFLKQTRDETAEAGDLG